jgi:hypothetical protein
MEITTRMAMPWPSEAAQACGGLYSMNHREQGAQHAAAVHGEGRDHVEDHHEDVPHHELLKEVPRFEEVVAGIELSVDAEAQIDRCGDDHIYQRTADRDDELLRGLARHAFQPRHAADGQQRDVRRADAVTTRGQDMPELMQHHAGEHGQMNSVDSSAAGMPWPLRKLWLATNSSSRKKVTWMRTSVPAKVKMRKDHFMEGGVTFCPDLEGS